MKKSAILLMMLSFISSCGQTNETKNQVTELSKNLETATFASGCFWCTEAIFKRIKGVTSVVSGYTGGKRENPTYDQVSTGATGHAEAIQIEFDPEIVSYDRLLQIFWHTHNPTTLNQQGADVGTQYRSAIFYHSGAQKEAAEKSKMATQKELEKEKIVTDIVPFEAFYKAEEHHQNYYDANPAYPYCSIVIDPKIEKLLRQFNEDVKDEYK